MKIKNLVITATAVAMIGGTAFTVSSKPVQAYTSEKNTSYTQNTYDVMYYFAENLQDNVENYLEKTKSSANLNKLLGYYDTLYDFVNNGKYVKSTYFKNLPYYEQETLNRMLTDWGNEIYDLYKNQSYFKTNCKNKLGFHLTYNSEEYGYDKDHETTMEHYTEKQNEKLEDYLSKNHSQSNLKNALDIYKKLVNFVKESTRSYGYIFEELTLTEQEELIELLNDWTFAIEYEYGEEYYYSSSCITKVGWTVNENNLNRELGENIDLNNGYYPNYSGNTTIPNIQTTPGTIPPAVPTTPNVQIPSTQIPTTQQVTPAPIVPSVPQTNNEQNVNVPNINNTVGKDWRQNYIDPSIDTSRNVRDYVPESVEDIFGNDDYIRYPQSYSNGYYDAYGNYIPYDYYNNYYNNGYDVYKYNTYYNYNNGYYDEYTPDYAPSKILK